MSNDIRKYLRIIEDANSPNLFFHGTNPLAAVMIFKDGYIEATDPCDDDEGGDVVCVTSEFSIGKMFAIEFERYNSQYDVGFVFELDANKIMSSFDVKSYESETASIDELEFRVDSNIPLSCCTGIKIVGNKSHLRNKEYLMDMFERGRNNFEFGQRYDDFNTFIKDLKQLCANCN